MVTSALFSLHLLFALLLLSLPLGVPSVEAQAAEELVLLPRGTSCDPNQLINYFFCEVSPGNYQFVYSDSYDTLVTSEVFDVISGDLQGNLLIDTGDDRVTLDGATLFVSGTLTVRGELSFRNSSVYAGDVVAESGSVIDLTFGRFFTDNFELEASTQFQKNQCEVFVEGDLFFDSNTTYITDPGVPINVLGCVGFQDSFGIAFSSSTGGAVAPFEGSPCVANQPTPLVVINYRLVGFSNIPGGGTSNGDEDTSFSVCTPAASLLVLIFGVCEPNPPSRPPPSPLVPVRPLFPPSGFVIPVPVTYIPTTAVSTPIPSPEPLTEESGDEFSAEWLFTQPWMIAICVIVGVLLIATVAVVIILNTSLKNKVFIFRKRKRYETEELY